jgi:hypothetical protein
MKKILLISNSFGVDGTRYLHGIARKAGEEVSVSCLFIGGCSLYRHYRNMLSEEAAYAYEINGHGTGLFVSLKHALLMDEWDYVVMQQCSPQSGEYDKYQPYLSELAAYVRRLCPPAKLVMQMTWTFSHECKRFKMTPFDTPEQMLPAIEDAYERAAESINAHFVIPSGRAMWKLYQEIGDETYRDGFHCHQGHSRYMLACMWFMAFTGKSVQGNSYRDFDTEISEEMIERVQRIATETMIEAGFEIK